jgi:CRISPR/Cas system-associated exonuclease Cas4 (RecB family)
LNLQDKSSSKEYGVLENKSLFLRSANKIASYSESGLRGYDKRTWASTTSSSLCISVSHVVSHYFCPRCAYLAFKGVRGFVSTLQTIEGQINHFVLEQLFASEANLIQLVLAQQRISDVDTVNTLLPEISQPLRRQTEEKFAASYKKLGGNFDSAWKKAERIISSRLYRVCANTEYVVPQRQFEIPLWSKELALKGRLDILEKGVPFEIKTGKVPQQGCSYYHTLQLTLYALILENKHHKDIDYGYVYYASSHDKRIVCLDEDIREEALRQRDITLATLLGNVEPEGKCRQCMQNQCVSMMITSSQSVLDMMPSQRIGIKLLVVLHLLFFVIFSIAIMIVSFLEPKKDEKAYLLPREGCLGVNKGHGISTQE